MLEDFNRFAREFEPRLRRYFFSRGIEESSGRVNDLVQDTLERAWRGRHGFRGDVELLPSWMFSIAESALKEHWRKVKRAREAGVYIGEERPTGAPQGSDDEHSYSESADQERNTDDDTSEGGEGDPITPETLAQRKRALALLWPDEREALQMRLAGSTEREIAKAMGISRAKAAALVASAAQSLEQDLSQEGPQ
jgi:RNA polymerase sigma factor (sigma-70 family)